MLFGVCFEFEGMDWCWELCFWGVFVMIVFNEIGVESFLIGVDRWFEICWDCVGDMEWLDIK